jgi:hypothetical protein
MQRAWKVTVVSGKAIDLELKLNELQQSRWTIFNVMTGSYGWIIITYMDSLDPVTPVKAAA